MVGYDPAAMPNVKAALGDRRSSCVKDAYTAATGADALVLVTEWHELRDPDLDRLKAAMRTPVLVRRPQRVADRRGARSSGFAYYGIGRKP